MSVIFHFLFLLLSFNVHKEQSESKITSLGKLLFLKKPGQGAAYALVSGWIILIYSI